jgi:hypothetical protein
LSEDWAAVAAEVEAAIVSVGDVSQPTGYPATIRRAGAATGDVWNPTIGNPTYFVVRCVVDKRDERDADGTLIASSKRNIMISGASGVVPTDNDKIILGQALAFVDATTDAGHAWQEIEAVKPLAPAGVAVMFELILAS